MKKRAVSLLMAGALVCSMGITAAAQVEDNTLRDEQIRRGQGYIAETGEPGTGTGGTLDVSVSSQSFMWQITEDTKAADGSSYEVESGRYSIVNNHDRANVSVTISYGVDAQGTDELSAVASDLKLKFTGDLAHADAEDMLVTPVTELTYDDVLEPLTTWEYGFGGTFDRTTLDQSMASDYIMTFGFEVTGVSQ